jgi:hypothetical protein
MKKFIKIVFVLAIIIFFISCGKKVINVDENYIGHWAERYSANSCCLTIKIYNDGAAYINIEGDDGCKCNGDPCFSGKARIKDNVLTIGSKKLNVDLKPTSIDTIINIRYTQGFYDGQANMIMILDGDTLFRIIGK